MDAAETVEAVSRATRHLIDVALRDTGQSRRVANFLLAWHNAEENGGWDPTDLWNIDVEIAREIVTILEARMLNHYPDGLGFEKEISAVWRQWRTR